MTRPRATYPLSSLDEAVEYVAVEGRCENTMAKQQWEEDAKNRFLQFLSTTANETWTALDQDVVVDPATNRNFDYRLGLSERRIALELFRLVKDEAELARGHLSWLLQLIVAANKRDLYQHTFEIVERYALSPNLYIRQQATIPLIEFAKRRFTDLIDSSLSDGIRTLTLRMARENASHPPILEGVANVVARMPDLTPSEAEEVLRIFLDMPSRDASQLLSFLLISYAVFRQRETRFGTFDSKNFASLLLNQVVHGIPAIRSSILWRIHGILDERPAEATALLPYAAAFPSGAYDRNAFFHFYNIAASFIGTYPDLLAPALKNAFCREASSLEQHAAC